ncbi:hypothetical protein Glove_438g7 [Diversispora epigaea]|uniref:Uncharacterized protein n=1 Tax=Diversispora epigaea TaxID=1348612 RepID=A0A397GW19_9GLOM|nr:hypothetical protein Glove_438g7 [Diversispora epigaea]
MLTTLQVSRFRQITLLAYRKAQNNGSFKFYPYLKIGEQLYYTYYLSIIETNHYQKSKIQESKSYLFIEQVSMLIKVLYMQRRNIELNPIHFQQMIVESDPQIGLYLSASRIAIDTLNSIGLSVCYITINNFKRKLANEHPLKIRNNYLYVYNLDDYHDIHEKKRPNTTTLSTAKYMATCICKQVSACAPVPIIFNGSSIHNPVNIDAKIGLYLSASRIAIDTLNSIGLSVCYITINNFKRKLANEHPLKIRNNYLYVYNLDDYHDIHEKKRPNTTTLSTAKYMATCICKQVSACAPVPIIFNGSSIHNPVNIDAKLLTVHFYDDAIAERKEERSMKGVRLIGFQEKNLHSMNNYVSALQLILDIDNDTGILYNRVAPLVADWPRQLFIHLLDNIIPATLNIYAILFKSGSFNEYVEIIFRIWTFALRWKRHNYNKTPLAFLSDIFYWEDTNHPFIEVVKLFLVNFNDYYVENYHSKIRAHTNTNNNVDNIIKQAFVIDEQNQCEIKNIFEKIKTYPYKLSSLNLLTEKTSLFLLEYFQEIFKNSGKKRLKKGPNILTSEERKEKEDILIEENEIIEEIEINESQEVYKKFLRSLNYVNACNNNNNNNNNK